MYAKQKVSKRSIGPSLFAAFLLMSLNACLPFGQLGIPMPGTISGTEVKAKVADSALIGYLFGVSFYCSKFSNSSACESSFSDGRGQGMILAQAMTPDLTPVEEGKYYGSFQGQACADQVLFSFWFLTGLYIGTKERTNADGSISIPNVTGAATEAAAVTALIAGPACEGGLNSSESDSESDSEGSSSDSDSGSENNLLPPDLAPAAPGFNGLFKPLAPVVE